MQGTMFNAREHFIQKLLLAILVHTSMQLLEASKMIDLQQFRWRLRPHHEFRWRLRPHHEAADFAPLLSKVRAGFDTIASNHSCPLFDKVRACVIDGKWSVQTPVCNDRASGLIWEPKLHLGYFRGCSCRPLPGSKYCREHSQCQVPPEDTCIQKHREKQTDAGLSLQYLVQDAWVDAASVPLEHVRAYELTLLRPKPRDSLVEEHDSCRSLSQHRKDYMVYHTVQLLYSHATIRTS